MVRRGTQGAVGPWSSGGRAMALLREGGRACFTREARSRCSPGTAPWQPPMAMVASRLKIPHLQLLIREAEYAFSVHPGPPRETIDGKMSRREFAAIVAREVGACPTSCLQCCSRKTIGQ